MNKLTFSITQIDEGPAVMPLIDGAELFHKDWNIGLSILDFFHTTKLMHTGESILGICSCGCEGCDDYIVNINVQDDMVVWEKCIVRADDDSQYNPVTFHFDKAEYISAVEDFMRECSDYLDRENKGSIDYTFNLFHSELEKEMKSFCPPIRDDKQAYSSNLITRFAMSFKSFTYVHENVSYWTQIPIQMDGRQEYIEGLIVNTERKVLYFIETRKECKQPKLYLDFSNIIEDIRDHIYLGSGDFYGLNLHEYDSYVVYLTDEMYRIHRLFSSLEYKSHVSIRHKKSDVKLTPQAYLAYADDIGFEAALALANSVN